MKISGFLTGSVFPLLLLLPAKGLTNYETVELANPQITNWGTWGTTDFCPDDTVVIGMKLKTQPTQGPWLTFGDDSALNGIIFICGDPSAEDVGKSTVEIHSMVGSKGSWGQVFTCKANQYARGFQMNSEGKKDYCDDTAANNLRLMCADYNATLTTVLEGDGKFWGTWTETQLCPAGLAMCSLTTQVGSEERPKEGRDYTGLNNIVVSCCFPKARSWTGGPSLAYA